MCFFKTSKYRPISYIGTKGEHLSPLPLEKNKLRVNPQWTDSSEFYVRFGII